MTRPLKNLEASVRQRLQNLAKQTNRPFQETLSYYAMERFLYRLVRSPHSGRFVLKGALLLRAWNAPGSRSTKDIDLLGRMESTVAAVVPVFRDVCCQQVEPDGLEFHAGTVAGIAIKEDADYAGVRVTFLATLQNSRVAMQVDVGFGDVVTPAPVSIEYPTLLEFPAPRMKSYNRETVVAEKFEAMIKLGMLNSRLKDFFDIWLLSQQFDLEGAPLAAAVARTFEHRKTAVVPSPFALTPAFAAEPGKRMQWLAFLRKAKLDGAPQDLREVLETLRSFLIPVTEAILAGREFRSIWIAGGPWQGV